MPKDPERQGGVDVGLTGGRLVNGYWVPYPEPQTVPAPEPEAPDWAGAREAKEHPEVVRHRELIRALRYIHEELTEIRLRLARL